MPPYPWLTEWSWDPAEVEASMGALQMAGTPYTDDQVAAGPAEARVQADAIVGRLAEQGITTTSDKEIVALIAYLQRLGRDGREALKDAP